MNTSPRMIRSRTALAALLAFVLSACPSLVLADDAPARGFALRNQHPLHQIYGLPPFQSARLVAAGETAIEVSLDITNHADEGTNAIEDYRIDGETHYLTLSVRRRIVDWLELGIDVPFVSHTDGFMDNMIESWHDIWSLSNSKRDGPSNLLDFVYSRNGEERFRFDVPASGVGDVQLSAAVPIREAGDGKAAISIRSNIKLSTGTADKLLGSGATDFATGLYFDKSTTLMERTLGIGGFAGVLVLGGGEVLPELQRDAVAFGGLSFAWQVGERTALVSHLYAQGSYFDSDLEELGGESLQLAVGADYRTRGGTLLRFAVVEDIAANATPDFALHFAVQGGAR